MSNDHPTPPPVGVDPYVWAELGALRRRVDECAQIAFQLDGVNDKDPGRVGRLEDNVKKHGDAIAALDKLTWKIVTAASLAGVATSILVGVVQWAIAR